jgi:hypothetical protein
MGNTAASERVLPVLRLEPSLKRDEPPGGGPLSAMCNEVTSTQRRCYPTIRSTSLLRCVTGTMPEIESALEGREGDLRPRVLDAGTSVVTVRSEVRARWASTPWNRRSRRAGSARGRSRSGVVNIPRIIREGRSHPVRKPSRLPASLYLRYARRPALRPPRRVAGRSAARRSPKASRAGPERPRPPEPRREAV